MTNFHLHSSHSSISTEQTYDNKQRYTATRKATLIGALTNLVLAFAQLFGGVFTHSQALLADGAHTLSDLATDFIVLIAAKLASKDADEDHPYGHGRYETVATIILGLILGLVAIGIAYDAVVRISNPEQLLEPELLGVFFACLAIVAKETLFRYTKHVANKINSPLLHANAWHHRSDAISSLVVLVGIAGTVLLEVKWLDALAALIVAVMIFIMAVNMLTESIAELVDTAIAPEKVKQIQYYIAGLDGVNNVHMLRTRQMAGRVLVDVHIQVDPYISVSEGHHIAENVMQALSEKFPELQDVTVHIDPEDDESASPCQHLPSRNTIIGQLQLHEELSRIGLSEQDSLQLHYLDGHIHLDVYLHKPQSITYIDTLKKACENNMDIGTVSIYLKLPS
jgi:cation diffusion facilitator family transporter